MSAYYGISIMNKQLRPLLFLASVLVATLPQLCQPSETDNILVGNSLILPDVCAIVGRVFQYYIPRLPAHDNSTQYYVTEAGAGKLPTWLHFQTSTNILQGVPIVQDEGYMYISVMIYIEGSNTQLPHTSITDVFSIDVRLNGEAHLLNKQHAMSLTTANAEQNNLEFKQKRTKCRPEQATYTASVVLDFRIEMLTGGERVTLVQNFAEFVSKHVDDVRLSARRSSTVSRLLDADVLAAGPGNINITEMHPSKITHGVELTWSLACGGFPKLNDFVRVITHNIEVGTISDVTGSRVIGWYVTREQPAIRLQKMKWDRREKRQAPTGGFATPVPTPTLTSAPPTAYVSTTTEIIQTSSSIQPPTISMISVTLQSSLLPILSSSFDDSVTATISLYPSSTISVPSFTPQPSLSITETMQVSYSTPMLSDFSLVYTSLTTSPTISSLYMESSQTSLTSIYTPDTSTTQVVDSITGVPQSTMMSRSMEVTLTSLSSFETPYITSTITGSIPTLFPTSMIPTTTTPLSAIPSGLMSTIVESSQTSTILSTADTPSELSSVIMSTIPMMSSSSDVTSLTPSTTVSLQTQSVPSNLPSTVLLPSLPLTSSGVLYSTTDASATLVLSSIQQSTSRTPVTDTASRISTTTTPVFSTTHIPPTSTIMIQPSPTDISSSTSTASVPISHGSDFSTTMVVTPITSTEGMTSLTPSLIETTSKFPESPVILTSTASVPRMTLTTSMAGEQSIGMSSHSLLASSILPSDIPTTALSSSLTIIPSMLMSSTEQVMSQFLSATYTYTASELSMSPSSAVTSTVLPLSSSMLPVTSQTSQYTPATTATFTQSSTMLPESSTLFLETSHVSPDLLPSSPSMVLSRTSPVVTESSAYQPSTSALPPISTMHDTLTATQLASSIIREPSVSTTSINSVPSSFNSPSTPAATMNSTVLTLPTQPSSTVLIITPVTPTIEPSPIHPTSTVSPPSASTLTSSMPVLETSVVMGSESFISPSYSTRSYGKPSITIYSPSSIPYITVVTPASSIESSNSQGTYSIPFSSYNPTMIISSDSTIPLVSTSEDSSLSTPQIIPSSTYLVTTEGISHPPITSSQEPRSTPVSLPFTYQSYRSSLHLTSSFSSPATFSMSVIKPPSSSPLIVTPSITPSDHVVSLSTLSSLSSQLHMTPPASSTSYHQLQTSLSPISNTPLSLSSFSSSSPYAVPSATKMTPSALVSSSIATQPSSMFTIPFHFSATSPSSSITPFLPYPSSILSSFTISSTTPVPSVSPSIIQASTISTSFIYSHISTQMTHQSSLHIPNSSPSTQTSRVLTPSTQTSHLSTPSIQTSHMLTPSIQTSPVSTQQTPVYVSETVLHSSYANGGGSSIDSMVYVSPVSSGTVMLSPSSLIISTRLTNQSGFSSQVTPTVIQSTPAPSTALPESESLVPVTTIAIMPSPSLPMTVSTTSMSPVFPESLGPSSIPGTTQSLRSSTALETTIAITPTPSLSVVESTISTSPLLTQSPVLSSGYGTSTPTVTTLSESLRLSTALETTILITPTPSYSVVQSTSSLAPVLTVSQTVTTPSEFLTMSTALETTIAITPTPSYSSVESTSSLAPVLTVSQTATAPSMSLRTSSALETTFEITPTPYLSVVESTTGFTPSESLSMLTSSETSIAITTTPPLSTMVTFTPTESQTSSSTMPSETLGMSTSLQTPGVITPSLSIVRSSAPVPTESIIFSETASLSTSSQSLITPTELVTDSGLLPTFVVSPTQLPSSISDYISTIPPVTSSSAETETMIVPTSMQSLTQTLFSMSDYFSTVPSVSSTSTVAETIITPTSIQSLTQTLSPLSSTRIVTETMIASTSVESLTQTQTPSSDYISTTQPAFPTSTVTETMIASSPMESLTQTQTSSSDYVSTTQPVFPTSAVTETIIASTPMESVTQTQTSSSNYISTTQPVFSTSTITETMVTPTPVESLTQTLSLSDYISTVPSVSSTMIAPTSTQRQSSLSDYISTLTPVSPINTVTGTMVAPTPTRSLTQTSSTMSDYISTDTPISPTGTATETMIVPTSTRTFSTISPSSSIPSATSIPSSISIPSQTLHSSITSEIGMTSFGPVYSTTLFPPTATPSVGLMTSSSNNLATPESTLMQTLTSTLQPSPSPSGSILPTLLPTTSSLTSSSSQSLMVSSSVASSLTPSPNIPVSSYVATLSTLSLTPSPVISSTIAVVSSDIRPSPTPVQPSSSMTMSSSVLPDITTPEPINQPPILLNPVDLVTANLGEFLHRSIPSNTFYDPEDGYTPNLTLSLRTIDHTPVTPDSWLQLDPVEQVLYGVPLNSTIANYEVQYYLTAADSEGLLAFDAMVVVIVPSVDIYTHVFSIEIDESYPNFITDANNIVQLGNRVADFYSDVNASALYIESIHEGSVIMTYSNTSLDIDVCDLTTIDALFNQISYPNGTATLDFATHMLPEFPVLFVTKRLQGACTVPPLTTPTAGNVTALPVTDKNLVAVIVVPAVVIAALLLLICCIACCWYKRHRAGEEFLIPEEKKTYAKNRKPIFLNDELTGLAPTKPTQPTILPNDISPFMATPKSAGATPPEKKRPAPPTYRLPELAKSNYANPYYDHHDPDYPKPDYRKPDILLIDMSLPNTRLPPPPRYTSQPEYTQPPLSHRIHRTPPAMPTAALYSPPVTTYSPPPVEVHRPPPRYTLPPPYDDDEGEAGFFPTSHV